MSRDIGRFTYGSRQERFSRRARVVTLFAATFFVWTLRVADAHGGDETVIHACVKTNGDIRIVGPADLCKAGETPVHWSIAGPTGPGGPQGSEGPQGPQGSPGPGLPASAVHWIDIYSLRPGPVDPAGGSVIVRTDLAGNSGIFLLATAPGERWVQTSAPVPPGYLVTGVRLCYRLSTSASFISQIRLIQEFPALIVLDDGTDLTNIGPVCVDSAPPLVGPLDPNASAITLNLRNSFASTSDQIRILAVGLHLQRAD